MAQVDGLDLDKRVNMVRDKYNSREIYDQLEKDMMR